MTPGRTPRVLIQHRGGNTSERCTAWMPRRSRTECFGGSSSEILEVLKANRLVCATRVGRSAASSARCARSPAGEPAPPAYHGVAARLAAVAARTRALPVPKPTDLGKQSLQVRPEPSVVALGAHDTCFPVLEPATHHAVQPCPPRSKPTPASDPEFAAYQLPLNAVRSVAVDKCTCRRRVPSEQRRFE